MVTRCLCQAVSRIIGPGNPSNISEISTFQRVQNDPEMSSEELLCSKSPGALMRKQAFAIN